jgi:hypothetical protein
MAFLRGDLNDELAVLCIIAVENGRDADRIKARREPDPSGRAPNQVIVDVYGEEELGLRVENPLSARRARVRERPDYGTRGGLRRHNVLS